VARSNRVRRYSRPGNAHATSCGSFTALHYASSMTAGIEFGENMQKNAGKRKVKWKNCKGNVFSNRVTKKVKC
jgi:hypothetical protein